MKKTDAATMVAPIIPASTNDMTTADALADPSAISFGSYRNLAAAGLKLLEGKGGNYRSLRGMLNTKEAHAVEAWVKRNFKVVFTDHCNQDGLPEGVVLPRHRVTEEA